MVNYEMIVILKLLTMVLVTTHTEACLFWFIGSVQHLEGRSSWLEDSGLEVGEVSPATTARMSSLNYTQKHAMLLQDVWGNYVVSLYWSVVTYTTVGYGDICPANKAETAYAICVMVRGCCARAHWCSFLHITCFIRHPELLRRARISRFLPCKTLQIINMALTAYVLGNITMLTTRADQFVLEYRDSVSQVAGYLKRKVRS